MIEKPRVLNRYLDQARGITFNVMAYRTLTQEELLYAVALYWKQKGGKKTPKPGTVITIISSLSG